MRAINTQAVGTPTPSQHSILDWEKLSIYDCAPEGVQTQDTDVIIISSPTLYQVNQSPLRHFRQRWAISEMGTYRLTSLFVLISHFVLIRLLVSTQKERDQCLVGHARVAMSRDDGD